MMSEKEFDTRYTDSPVCPYCGIVFEDYISDMKAGKGDGDRWEEHCDECDKDFIITLDVEVTFCTEEKEIK